MTEKTFKECPGCANTDIDSGYSRDSDGYYEPGCMKCGFNAPKESWNTRAPSKDRKLLVELSLPDVPIDNLIMMSFLDKYSYDGYRKQDAVIALKIRMHLEDNP